MVARGRGRLENDGSSVRGANTGETVSKNRITESTKNVVRPEVLSPHGTAGRRNEYVEDREEGEEGGFGDGPGGELGGDKDEGWDIEDRRQVAGD